MTAASPGRSASSAWPLLAILTAGAAVSVFFGAYAQVHDPARESTISLFFSGTLNLKVWFASVALVLAVAQVVLALRIYDKVKIPRTVPPWLGDLHRLVGTLAFLFTLPVAFHCLWALGFQDASTRALVHSIAGCAFYGMFVAKVLSVRATRLPSWVLPAVGSATFAVLAVLWATSSLWFFQNVDFPGV